ISVPDNHRRSQVLSQKERQGNGIEINALYSKRKGSLSPVELTPPNWPVEPDHAYIISSTRSAHSERPGAY
ncbi:hypothetical protein, partial [Salmonella sp. SAL4458]|uniref:hypothetical protein n=1 Tax=Salmonella sp. SAL4458 TaxID=3159913 RepID=UPI003978B92A